jgi:NADPH:quinone reductase-like Zn-dependent oxidoreductase
VKSAMGWNFPPSSLGSHIMDEIVSLYERGAIRAVVGRVAAFEEIPEAIDAMAHRNSIGRTVIVL